MMNKENKRRNEALECCVSPRTGGRLAYMLLVSTALALSFSDVFLFETTFVSVTAGDFVSRGLFLEEHKISIVPRAGKAVKGNSTEKKGKVARKQHGGGAEKVLVEGIWRRSTPLAEFALGIGAPFISPGDNETVVPLADLSHAACEFRTAPYSDHFPHTMQQLYRCFSWWQANPDKIPVLIMKAIPRGFVQKYVQAMQDVFHVQLDETDSFQNISVYFNLIGDGEQKKAAYEMVSSEHADTLREGIQRFYGISNQEKTGAPAGCSTVAAQPNANQDHGGNKSSHGNDYDVPPSKKLPVIGFLNRKVRRRVTNHEEILDALRAKYDANSTGENLTIHYLDSFDDKSFLKQVSFMSKVDILIGPHGAQFTGILFQPPCGGLLELFPKGYCVPEFIGSLALSTGHFHYSMYTGKDQRKELAFFNKNAVYRAKARSFQIHADPNVLTEGVQELVTRWQSCCQSVGSSRRHF